MKGLELSKAYYQSCCVPMLKRDFPVLEPRIAAGLVGEGSECLGFDDAISRDHDWGAAVCLWLAEEDYSRNGARLTEALRKLPADKACGMFVRLESEWSGGRAGVFEIGDFFFRHLGRRTPPQTLAEWLLLPESRLATATNGEVFSDTLGKFTAFRNVLQGYYPEDVRLKKIACRLAGMAQSGQYNYPRCLARKQYTAACLAAGEFIKNATSLVHLLNRRYTPYYKWMHHSLKTLPLIGRKMHALIGEMTGPPSPSVDFYRNGYDKMQKICTLISRELNSEGLSEIRSDFLLDYGVDIQKKIHSVEIRSIDLFLG